MTCLQRSMLSDGAPANGVRRRPRRLLRIGRLTEYVVALLPE